MAEESRTGRAGGPDGLVRLGPAGWLRDGADWVPPQPFYAVIGDPVGHSLSPRLHGAALAERGLPHEYVALQVAADQLPALKARPQDLAGFNVTAPHKEGVAALCDGRTEQARALGAVNTVRVEDGRWLGHNTDSGGARGRAQPAVGRRRTCHRSASCWAPAVPRARPSTPCCVGAWGRWKPAGLATGARPVRRLAGRTWPRRGSEPGAAAAGRRAAAVRTLCLDLLPGRWRAVPAVPAAGGRVRAGAAGRRPLRQPTPGRRAPLGFAFSDGLPLLLMQGGLSFAWWFGPPVPWAAMHASLPAR